MFVSFRAALLLLTEAESMAIVAAVVSQAELMSLRRREGEGKGREKERKKEVKRPNKVIPPGWIGFFSVFSLLSLGYDNHLKVPRGRERKKEKKDNGGGKRGKKAILLLLPENARV